MTTNNRRKWVAVSITIAIVALGIVLHLVQPNVTYAMAELMCAFTFIGGAVAGYFYGKSKQPIVEKDKEE